MGSVFGSSRFLGVFLFIYFFPRLERLGTRFAEERDSLFAYM
jgi:hypothetical protein